MCATLVQACLPWQWICGEIIINSLIEFFFFFNSMTFAEIIIKCHWIGVPGKCSYLSMDEIMLLTASQHQNLIFGVFIKIKLIAFNLSIFFRVIFPVDSTSGMIDAIKQHPFDYPFNLNFARLLSTSCSCRNVIYQFYWLQNLCAANKIVIIKQR